MKRLNFTNGLYDRCARTHGKKWFNQTKIFNKNDENVKKKSLAFTLQWRIKRSSKNRNKKFVLFKITRPSHLFIFTNKSPRSLPEAAAVMPCDTIADSVHNYLCYGWCIILVRTYVLLTMNKYLVYYYYNYITLTPFETRGLVQAVGPIDITVMSDHIIFTVLASGHLFLMTTTTATVTPVKNKR